MDSELAADAPPPADRRYEFFAFISYKHEDMGWAKWLQNRLENYRLPSVIRKEAPHLPKSIRPIFRDQTDIGAGPLMENLRQELEDSRYLIVICSPSASKSEWVDREVEHFQAMGRGERIIPFIVAGEPGAADPGRECFPTALRGGDEAMLGVSAEELGREKAAVKVVARLLGLKFDRLWDRHRRRQRQQRLFRGLTAAALFLAMAIGGFAYWDYHRTKVAYYADYVESRGVPQGIGKVKTVRYLDIGGQPCPTRQGIAGKQYEYDAQGNRTQTTWTSRTGSPVPNEDGYAICGQKYDADGNVVDETYCGTDGKPGLTKDGLRRREADFRRAGKQDEHVLLRHGRPAWADQGRLCRMEVHLRRAGKPDEPVLFRRPWPARAAPFELTES